MERIAGPSPYLWRCGLARTVLESNGQKIPSFPRRRESSFDAVRYGQNWMPACAGMTGVGVRKSLNRRLLPSPALRLDK